MNTCIIKICITTFFRPHRLYTIKHIKICIYDRHSFWIMYNTITNLLKWYILNLPAKNLQNNALNCLNLLFPYPCAFETAAKLMTNKSIRNKTTIYKLLIVMIMLITSFPHQWLDIYKYLMAFYVLLWSDWSRNIF